MRFHLMALLLIPMLAAGENRYEFLPDRIQFSNGLFSLSLNYLQIFSRGKYAFPEEVRTTQEGAALHYPEGVTAAVSPEPEGLVYHFEKAGGIDAVKLFATLPIALVRDGAFEVGGHRYDFPSGKVERDSLYRGDAASLVICPAGGGMLELTLHAEGGGTYVSAMLPGWRAFTWWSYLPVKPLKTPVVEIRIPVREPEAPVALVDRFGQPANRDFAGKVKSEAELRADLEADRAYYDSFQPPPRTIYGGLPGSREQYGLEATGFFRVTKVAGRDFFVTPEGDLFYQLGVCSVGPCDDYTFIEGRRGIYEWLPPTDGEFATAYMGKRKENFSFYLANVIRKTGKPFDGEAWKGEQTDRIRRLGFNSMGAFAEPGKSMRRKNLPYTPMLPVAEVPELIPGIFDPYEEESVRKLDSLFAAKVAPRADDPLIIGWFIANEQRYTDLLRRLPLLGADRAAKRELARFLQQRYRNVESFNQAWEVQLRDLSQIAQSSLPVKSESAQSDMVAFAGEFLETYFKLIHDTFRRHDGNHLLLGARFLPPVSRELEAAVVASGRYTDVFSVNYYTRDLDFDYLEHLHKLACRPLLLSEWSFGTAEQGLAGGCVDVRDQEERGLAYRNYVEGTAALLYVIGCQYFAYLDQALTGRWFQKYNGESMNIGLVNVADRPFRDFNRELVKSNYAIYDIALGKREPYRLAPLPAEQRRDPKTTQIPRALPGMAVDGEYRSWPNRPSIRLGGTDLTAGTMRETFNADVNLAWDDEFLYFFAVVREPTPGVNTARGSGLWYGDSIEFFIGVENPGKDGKLLFSDRQVIIGAVPETPHWWFFSPEQFPVKVDYRRHPDRGGWTMEGAVPWKAMDFQPKSCDQIRFDFGFDDAAVPRKRLRQFMWSGSEQNSRDRTGWGRATLVD